MSIFDNKKKFFDQENQINFCNDLAISAIITFFGLNFVAKGYWWFHFHNPENGTSNETPTKIEFLKN